MARVHITGAAVSDIGLHRRDNEDSYIAQDGLYLVADGMGGGIDGRAASAEIIQQIARLSGTSIRSRAVINECIQNAQQALTRIGAQQGAMAGTTLSGLILKDTSTLDPDQNAWYVVNIGDSRTYHLNRSAHGWDASSLVQVTRDHSRRQEAIDSGRLLPDQARELVPRNIITQAVGSPQGVVADFYRADVEGRFIICSDGVYSELSPAQLTTVSAEALDPKSVAQDLVNAALDAGGNDNATVVVVDVTQDVPDVAVSLGGTEKDWNASILADSEEIDTLNDSTLETLRTTERK